MYLFIIYSKVLPTTEKAKELEELILSYGSCFY